MATEETSAEPINVPVFDSQGNSVGNVAIDPAEFGGKINRQLLHDCVVMHLNNQRAGTHSTLRRGEVAGSTKKLFRQKGTGHARVGNRRTNKRRGGGTAKGPKPRDYEYHLPKKAVRAATRMALLSKFQDKETLILEELSRADLLGEPEGEQEPKVKTRKMVDLLSRLKLGETSCLIGTAGHEPEIYRAARNIPGVQVAAAREFNVYTLLHQKRLVLTKAALEQLRQGPPKQSK